MAILNWVTELVVYVGTFILNTYIKMYVYDSAYILDNYIAEDVWATTGTLQCGSGGKITYIIHDTSRTSLRTDMYIEAPWTATTDHVNYITHVTAAHCKHHIDDR